MSKCPIQNKTKLSKRGAERFINNKQVDYPLRYYYCEHCHSYHLTKQEKKEPFIKTYLKHYQDFKKYLCR